MILGIFTRYNNFPFRHSARYIRNEWKKLYPNCKISLTWFPNSRSWDSVSICVSTLDTK